VTDANTRELARRGHQAHDELTRRAVRWLRGTMRCGVVLSEVIGDGHEQPDAIGWKRGGLHSILVEVKTSRADFIRDQRKWHRRARLTVGVERYYFTPPGLARVEELPEGWGLAEAGKRIKVLARAERADDQRFRHEIPLLFAALRKVELGLPIDWLHGPTGGHGD